MVELSSHRVTTVSVDRVEPIEGPTHADLPPHVEAKDYIRVRATVRGQALDDAVALGWCGQDVYITWRSDMGEHLGWVPAADVERMPK